MRFSFSSLNYKQKSLVAEACYLFFLGVLSPFAVGSQIFTQASYTWSLVLLNIFSLAAVILFYRVYLPQTMGKRRYVLLVVLFPVYIVVYELIARLSAVILLRLPFVPEGYKNNVRMGRPEDFSSIFAYQTFGYTCLVLAAATSIYMIRMLFKQQHSLYEAQTDKLRLELDHLKSQVQPHFFFNTLNNLYALSVQNSPKTPGIIADLSSIMRYVLYNSQQEKVHLQQEIGFIQSYIQLENVRHDNPEAIEFLVQGNTGATEIEPLLFLPLIENAFKHSLQKNLTSKWVKLALVVDDDELTFQTSNPVPENTLSSVPEGGIGLKNVSKRLELLYPGKHQLIVHDADCVFTVTLTIQLK
ncbi:hypothetical protein DYU05_01325 [Mucilaginibacter terrenus]|uniref:Signal transduction histidine kinase internal region domain-containing protein n=1 Tax=Mucilaginibacter terrenus TaxID=2482727 RepID=A0A3E2NTK1_9SPHI|nr:sensor histidine kinase [Mucilaginibacter terrenus]RFZ84299.1 hypothetical protein DYU05_01325 [Mucilaginibacter terrenus]